MSRINTLLSYILIKIIRTYQYVLSPWLGNHCRFHPSCSHYAAIAIERHGPGKGLILAIKRLARCHPWHRGGEDPVPEISNQQKVGK